VSERQSARSSCAPALRSPSSLRSRRLAAEISVQAPSESSRRPPSASRAS
jgi:hypothetical protein